MRSDEEVVLAAVTDHGRVFKYAASVLRETKAFVLRALKVGGNLEFRPPHFAYELENSSVKYHNEL
jgi:hypothetical protein